jgi:CsoR family transcriptional regulator, copper-sensing transcriptional repressor
MSERPPGYEQDKAAILTRLKRIEGQVRGLQRMVEEGSYCIDVLTQVSAASSALQSVAVKMLDEHLRHCVAAALQSEDPSETDRVLVEANKAIERLIRS